MNQKTLFNAYRECRNQMDHYLILRKILAGIAVAGDRYAKEWQRYDRLSGKIELRMAGRKFCPICGCPNYAGHFSKCSRYEKGE